MSVYEKRRKDSGVYFLRVVTDLRSETIRITKKFPKSMWTSITRNLIKMTASIYKNCLKGNDIYMYADMDKEDYKLRKKYFMKARTKADAMSAEITFCYAYIRDNSVDMTRRDRNRIFKNWSLIAMQAANLIKKVIDADKARWRKWKEDRKKDKKEKITISIT